MMINNNGVKPITTEYKGYRFRSRLEARWAVFFDALGVQWEYEPEGYDLGDAGWYLPDFWLPRFNDPVGMFVEVKPQSKRDDGNKARALCIVADLPMLMAVGMPDCKVFNVFYPGASHEEDVGGITVSDDYFDDKYVSGSRSDEYRMFVSCADDEDANKENNPEVYKAVCAARCARFERVAA